jgi:hypothetical protein
MCQIGFLNKFSYFSLSSLTLQARPAQPFSPFVHSLQKCPDLYKLKELNGSCGPNQAS